MAQKDAELEFSYLSQLIQGNLEKYKSYDRVVVNYLKLDTIIEYFSRHKLYSIKAKSLEKWLQIYQYRKNRPASEPVDLKRVKKDATFKKSTGRISAIKSK